MDPSISNIFIWAFMLGNLIAGTTNTIIYKLQNETTQITSNGQYDQFNHPFMQAATMFLGEAVCYFLFIYQKKQPLYKEEQIQSQKKQGYKKQSNYLLISIPAICDLAATTLAYIALVYVPPSIYQMMKGGQIIFSGIWLKFILKKEIQNYQWFGSVMTLIGLILVGLSGVVFPPDNTDDIEYSATYYASILLLVLSVLFQSVQLVFEEWLFDHYFLYSSEVVGIQGIWGVSLYVVICAILTFSPCPSSLESTCLPYDGEYYFERIDYYFQQVFSNGILVILVILGIVSMATFNITGISITKYVSSLTRSIINVSRTLFVWLIGLIVTWSHPESPWENTQLSAILLQLAGFILLISGNLIYLSLLRLPFLFVYNSISQVHNLQYVKEKESDCEHHTEDEQLNLNHQPKIHNINVSENAQLNNHDPLPEQEDSDDNSKKKIETQRETNLEYKSPNVVQ